MLRIGILGAARIAPPAIIVPSRELEDVMVTAVAARDPARAQAFCAEHQVEAAATTYAELVARDDVDLVYVAGPPSTHAEWTMAALEAGKHVLVEKPSALNATETTAMIATAAKTGRRCIEAFHYRYHRVMARALEIIGSGELGSVRTINARFEVPIARNADEFRWQRPLGGGSLMDLGCYPLHWARTVAGTEPVIEEAHCVFDDQVDVSTRAILSFGGGITAEIACSMAPHSQTPTAYLTVEGSRGTLAITNPLAPQWGCRFAVTIDGQERVEAMPTRTTYAYQLEAVRDAVRNGTPVPTEGADTLGQMRAIDAIYAEAGRPPL